MTSSKFAPSNSEARRLLNQGGVKINGEKVENFNEAALKNGDILQVGKKKFLKIIM
jgi:tyrosyl-tRNA synthetase